MAPPVLPAPCKYCGLMVQYLFPGNPPGDCEVASLSDLPVVHRPQRNYTLVTAAGVGRCFGASAQSQQGVAIGQFAHHDVHGLNGA